LNWFVSFYEQFAIIFPYLVAAPRYFAGEVGMGFIFQTSSALGEVRGALSWFINVYPQFASWKATVDRLTTFNASMERVRSDAREAQGERAEARDETLGIEALELALPQGKPLLAPTSIELRPVSRRSLPTWSEARTGRRCSPAASNSGSRSRGPCSTSPTGCSSTRRRHHCPTMRKARSTA